MLKSIFSLWCIRDIRILGVSVAAICMFSAQAAFAQDEALTNRLVANSWCQESVTGISTHQVRLTFQPNGSMRLRKEIDMENGSHNATNLSAGWFVRSGTLVIAEPNGGESRFPVIFRGIERSTELVLGNATYTVCR